MKKIIILIGLIVLFWILFAVITTNIWSVRAEGNHEGDQTCHATKHHPCPSPSPSVSPSPEPSISPEPIATPSATPEPVSEPYNSASDPDLSGSKPHEIVCAEIKYQPTVIGFERISPTSVKFTWSKVDGFVEDYLISYGLDEKADMWNTIVHGNEVVLNFLPENMSIWAKIAGVNQGCQGNFGLPVDP